MTIETEIKNILVFKTNVKTEKDYSNIKMVLDLHASIEEWSIDREDADCVLRIGSRTLSENYIIELVSNLGFSCNVLV